MIREDEWDTGLYVVLEKERERERARVQEKLLASSVVPRSQLLFP